MHATYVVSACRLQQSAANNVVSNADISSMPAAPQHTGGLVLASPSSVHSRVHMQHASLRRCTLPSGKRACIQGANPTSQGRQEHATWQEHTLNTGRPYMQCRCLQLQLLLCCTGQARKPDKTMLPASPAQAMIVCLWQCAPLSNMHAQQNARLHALCTIRKCQSSLGLRNCAKSKR